MQAFLAELGKKAAEKWVTLTVLSGLLYVSAAWVTAALGHGHWVDKTRLGDRVARLADSMANNPVTAVLIIAAALLLAAGVGLAAVAVSGLVRRAWLGEWGWLAALGRPLTARRKQRWITARDAAESAARHGASAEENDRLAARRNRIALTEPHRPTWMGDRMRAADVRVFLSYGLDLVFTWPRMWLVIPDNAREELRIADNRFQAASVLAAWGILYGALGLYWWPGALIGAVTVLIGWLRGRQAIDAYASLVESVVDIYGYDLAKALTDNQSKLTSELGTAATIAVRKWA